MYELRLLNVAGDHEVEDLPVVATGPHNLLRHKAEKKGYVWVSVPAEVNGQGYYVHPTTGDVMYLVQTDRLICA